MFKVRTFINIENLMLSFSISLIMVITGCASTSTSPLKLKSTKIRPISKNTLSDTGEPINIDTRPNGVVWQLMPKAPGGLITQGNGLFISLLKPTTSPKVLAEVGDQPYISVDGRNWTSAPSRIPMWGRSSIFAEGWFYIIGEGIPPHNNLGFIMRSKDGVNWENVFSRGKNPFTNIRYLNGRFVVTGQNGVVATSHDGKHWQQQQIKNVPAFYDADYFDGEYLLTGDAMALYSSNDLASWRNLSTENLLSAGPRSLQHNTDILLLQTNYYIYIYRDKHWSFKKLKKDSSGFDNYISKLLPSSEDFVITNKNKQVLRSQDGINWTVLSQLQTADPDTICEARCIVYDYQIVKLPKSSTQLPQ